MSFDVVIENGRVIDGTGNPWFRADIGIQDDKIARVSKIKIGKGDRTIDANDKFIVPGFINIHSHSDRQFLSHNKCESSVKQGITTDMAGPNGRSLYPIREEKQQSLEKYLNIKAYGVKVNVDWFTLAGWRKTLEKKGIAMNVAPLVGLITIRDYIMGEENMTKPTENEMNEMKRLISQVMEDGAFGLSTGLKALQFTIKEVAELCKVVAKYGGLYHSDARESPPVIEGFYELIKIAEMGGIRGHRTIHKASGLENWGKAIETIRIIDRTRARGIEITFDQYPWKYAVIGNVGKWFLSRDSVERVIDIENKENFNEIIKNVKDPKIWDSLKKSRIEEIERDKINTEKLIEKLNKKKTAFGAVWRNPGTSQYIVHSRTHPEAVGKNFYEIAEKMCTEHYLDAIKKIWIDDDGETYTSSGYMCEEDIKAILRHPTTSVTTDGRVFDSCPPIYHAEHPRTWGTYPKVLEKYVREESVLKIENAIRKMTSLPAQIMQIRDRGLLKKNMYADIVIFDLKKIKNKATYENPYQFPDGIPYVIVNGQIVVEDGECTGNLPGKVLFHKP